MYRRYRLDLAHLNLINQLCYLPVEFLEPSFSSESEFHHFRKDNITGQVPKMESSEKEESATFVELAIQEAVDGETVKTSVKPVRQRNKPKQLTEEDIKNKQAIGMAKYKENIAAIMQNAALTEDGSGYTDVFINAIKNLIGAASALNAAPVTVYNAYTKQLAKELFNSELIPKLCEMAIDGLKKGYKNSEGEIMLHLYNPLKQIIMIFVNSSDDSPDVAEALCLCPGLLEAFAEKLTEMHGNISALPMKREDIKIVKYIMTIIHNALMTEREPVMHRMRAVDMTAVLIPYLDCPEEDTRLIALSSLADIVDEKGSEILQARGNVVRFLLTAFQEALTAKLRRYFGWSASELARTVRRLARNDANKKVLVAQGSLPLLVNLAETGTEPEEQIEAVSAIWALAFDENNQREIIENEELGVIDILVKYMDSSIPDVKKGCRGALWTMRERLKTSSKYKKLGEDLSGSTQSTPSQRTALGHIMVSYQWANQQTILKIVEVLRSRGYKIWIDTEQMGGSTLQAMAEAVEQAAVVLVCTSQKYKDSPNCRAEAEYAFQKRKQIVPLVLERGYKADGWLGFIIGAKLYFEFSGKYPFETKMEGLLTELQRKVEKPENSQITQAEPTDGRSSPRQADVGYTEHASKHWTNDQVQQWLKQHGLPSDKFGKLTGKEINFLRNLRAEAPEYFYQTVGKIMRNECHELFLLAAFTDALRDPKL